MIASAAELAALSAAPRRRRAAARPPARTAAALDPASFGLTAFDLFAGTPLKLAGCVRRAAWCRRCADSVDHSTLALSAASWQAVLYFNRTYILGETPHSCAVEAAERCQRRAR